MRGRDEDLIRALDAIESDMRRLESRIFGIRKLLRERIDPHRQRRDLGYWPDEDNGELRPSATQDAGR